MPRRGYDPPARGWKRNGEKRATISFPILSRSLIQKAREKQQEAAWAARAQAEAILQCSALAQRNTKALYKIIKMFIKQ